MMIIRAGSRLPARILGTCCNQDCYANLSCTCKVTSEEIRKDPGHCVRLSKDGPAVHNTCSHSALSIAMLQSAEPTQTAKLSCTPSPPVTQTPESWLADIQPYRLLTRSTS